MILIFKFSMFVSVPVLELQYSSFMSTPYFPLLEIYIYIHTASF